MQVAVEIRVQPKAGTDRAGGLGIGRSWPAPDHPPRSGKLDSPIDQRIVGKAAPSFKVSAERFFATNDRKQIARTTSAQRTNKLGEKAGRKGFTAGVELDLRFGWHTLVSHSPASFRGFLHSYLNTWGSRSSNGLDAAGSGKRTLGECDPVRKKLAQQTADMSLAPTMDRSWGWTDKDVAMLVGFNAMREFGEYAISEFLSPTHEIKLGLKFQVRQLNGNGHRRSVRQK
jgi:hypothetical protein